MGCFQSSEPPMPQVQGTAIPIHGLYFVSSPSQTAPPQQQYISSSTDCISNIFIVDFCFIS